MWNWTNNCLLLWTHHKKCIWIKPFLFSWPLLNVENILCGLKQNVQFRMKSMFYATLISHLDLLDQNCEDKATDVDPEIRGGKAGSSVRSQTFFIFIFILMSTNKVKNQPCSNFWRTDCLGVMPLMRLQIKLEPADKYLSSNKWEPPCLCQKQPARTSES